MTPLELQDYIHVYSLVSFKTGSKESGIIINKYNTAAATIAYFFVEHHKMNAYKAAFDAYDKKRCADLSIEIRPEEINSIRPISLADYKIIMELLAERNSLLSNS
ncbi:MAG: hypothetical protein RIQ89_886 [Bacteroidota bacterium]|jgi:hypothetical protein